MKKYNRALDYTVLALAQLSSGKPVMAARLLAKAGEQSDLPSAIAILEASNKQAFNMERLTAKKRITATDEFPFEDGQGEGELAADLGEDFEGDPLDDIEEDVALEADNDDDEDEDEDDELEEEVTKVPASVAMARVLASMKRKAQ